MSAGRFPALASTAVLLATDCTTADLQWHVCSSAGLPISAPDATLLGSAILLTMIDHYKPTTSRVQERSRALMPYLVPAPSLGIMGTLSLAKRLQKTILAAAQDPGRCSMPCGRLTCKSNNMLG